MCASAAAGPDYKRVSCPLLHAASQRASPLTTSVTCSLQACNSCSSTRATFWARPWCSWRSRVSVTSHECDNLGTFHLHAIPLRTGYMRGRTADAINLRVAGVRILYTGDYSCEEDRHLMAAEVPRQFPPDVLIVESTYGMQVRGRHRGPRCTLRYGFSDYSLDSQACCAIASPCLLLLRNGGRAGPRVA